MLLSLAPILLLVALLSTSVALFGSDASYGPNQVALVVAAAATMLVGWWRGMSWQQIQDGMVDAITVSIMPMMILLSVGALIGSWIISGTVPGMIFYGLQLLNPDIFYAASAVICALASLSLGSSWTVAGTLGIGLMGIATTYGLSPAITAGAIISGAYFGDKLSPLSDTTNLAAAAVGVDLFEHIKNMLWTTLPAFALALLFFAIIGGEGAAAPDDITRIRAALSDQFTITPWVLSPLVLMLAMIYFKIPAYPRHLAVHAMRHGLWCGFSGRSGAHHGPNSPSRITCTAVTRFVDGALLRLPVAGGHGSIKPIAKQGWLGQHAQYHLPDSHRDDLWRIAR